MEPSAFSWPFFQIQEDRPKYINIQKDSLHKPDISQNSPFYCVKCKNYKPLRAHHCRHCNKCTLRFDHHCPWIMNCVGLNNIKTFFMLVFFLAISGCYGVLTSIYFYFFDNTASLMSHPLKRFPMVILFFAYVFIATLMSVTLLAIWFSHTNQLCKNHTTLELLAGTEFNCFLSTYSDKSRLYGNRNEYDIGNYANFTSIFGENPAYWCFPIPTYKEKMKNIPEISTEEIQANRKKKAKLNVDDYIQRGLLKYDVNKLEYNDILTINKIGNQSQQENKSPPTQSKKEEHSVNIDITDDKKQL